MGLLSFQFRVLMQNLYTYILQFQNCTFHAFALAKTGSNSSMFQAILCSMQRRQSGLKSGGSWIKVKKFWFS